MAGSRGTSIRIFLVDGTAEGLRLVEKSNWTGRALVTARADYPRARLREELSGPGVYVLSGPSDEGPRLSIYVGEGDDVGKRLDTHARALDFWTAAVAFTSKDMNLNKAHVRYLEARLIDLAAQAGRARLVNGNAGTPVRLSEPDTADMESFLDEMLVLLPVIGIPVFDAAESGPGRTGPTLSLKGPDAVGAGSDGPEGFLVEAGALARVKEAPSIHAYVTTLRRQLADDGVLVPEGPSYRLARPYLFNSPSQAAAVLLGRTANGRVEWKDEQGRTLKQLQLLQVPRADGAERAVPSDLQQAETPEPSSI